jgi:hypothetical protein
MLPKRIAERFVRHIVLPMTTPSSEPDEVSKAAEIEDNITSQGGQNSAPDRNEPSRPPGGNSGGGGGTQGDFGTGHGRGTA